MERKKRLIVARRGIHWLESRAKLDRNLVHPDKQEIYLTHQQIQVEYMRTDKPEKTMTQINLNAKRQDKMQHEPTFFINYHGKLKEYEENKQRREKNRNKKIKENQEIFFKPAECALQLNDAAITLACNGDEDKAIDLFYTAYQSFPDIATKEFQITNSAYLPILFNLGKALFNTGKLEEGFDFLTHYHRLTNEGDFYRDKLESLFQIESSYYYKKEWVNAYYEGIYFRKDINGITLETNDVDTFNIIDLPFKQPVSLHIESKDKDNPELLDYFYLHQLIPANDDVARYEIVLPLNKIPVFVKEFYPGILEDSYITCETIKDLDVLITEHLMAESRERARKRYDYPVMDAHYFKSVLFINVPNHYKDAFLAEFRQFIKMHVVSELSDNEIDERELEGLKQDYESLLVWFRSELMKDFQYEREHLQYVAGVYADLKVLEQNLISSEKDPFATPDESLHKEYQQAYLKQLGGVFDEKNDYKEWKETKVESLEGIPFQNTDVKKSINTNWNIMLRLLEIDPSAALAKIRLVLEELLSNILEQEGHSLYRDNKRLTPTQMAQKIENKTGEDVKENIIQLHIKAKSCSHFEDNQYLYGLLDRESHLEAIGYLELLRKTILAIVHLFEL